MVNIYRTKPLSASATSAAVPATSASPLPFTSLHDEDYSALIIDVADTDKLQPYREE